MYLARPVQMGQHSLARNTSKSRAPPPPPAAPPPPELPQKLKPKSKPAPQLVTVKPVFDRDKLLDEVRCGVQLRHTLTNDKSAPTGVGRVRSGGYSPPPDSVASTSTYNSRPDAKKPVFYGKNIENTDVPLVPPAPPPPKAPPAVALLKLGGGANFDRDKLLNEIHGGVQLRKTVTNDRSAPIGVGTVRNDLSRAASPIPETAVLSNSATHLDVTSVPPPPVPPPPSPDFLSSQVHQNKIVKPVTNPALLKLGGKQPIDRDALLASIRGGVKLRKVETNDRSSPFPVSRDVSPDHHAPLEPVGAPPPPPLLVPPPPPIPSAEPIRRSRSPKPALMKLGGKVTVDRDELLRSIRQGVKLRKTVTNDKSSAIINDDDSGVRSPGRSSPSTSNYEDDVYCSQSLSDLSSIGTSRFSSLSNIPPEKSNDLYFASPVVPEASGRLGATSTSHSSSSTKSPLNLLPLINVSIDVVNYDDEDIVECEPETITLQLPEKRKADECYSSPIPTRKQIEAEIPAGSARDRIKMFGGSDREASHSPVQSLNRCRKLDGEVDSNEFGISRMRKLFGDTTVEQPTVSASSTRHTEEHEQAMPTANESSIRKMVRKFSTDDDTNKASQPIWCQKKGEKMVEEEKKIPPIKQKTSNTKSSMRKKSGTKGSKLRRKSSVKNEQPIATSKKTYAAPARADEIILADQSSEPEKEVEGRNNHLIRAVPKVDISKFKERFENPPEAHLTSEEAVKPGRIKKPPWIKDDESQPPPSSLGIIRKVEEPCRSSRKKAVESDEMKNSSKTTTITKPIHKQNSLDYEESSESLHTSTSTRNSSTGTSKKIASGLKKNDKISPLIKSSKKDIINASIVEEETTIPTREGVGPYRYTRKISATDKKPVMKKNSINSKETSAFNSGNLLNSIPKPFGTNFSTTGQTTTIGVDDKKDESKVASNNRHFVSKNKIQSKASVDREHDEVFDDKTSINSLNTKTTSERIDGIHYANVGVAVTKVYAVPINNISWNHSDNGHFMSTPSLNNGNTYGNLKQNNNYCISSTTTKTKSCKYPDNLRKYQSYTQQQQKLSLPPREYNGMIGRAHRVIVGVSESHSKMTTISKSFQQRSFDDNIPIACQQQQQQQQKQKKKHEQQQDEHHLFHQNYRFQIDLENDQEPLRIVHR
ncbi:WH2 motif family protein [Brugia pahangi]